MSQTEARQQLEEILTMLVDHANRYRMQAESELDVNLSSNDILALFQKKQSALTVLAIYETMITQTESALAGKSPEPLSLSPAITLTYAIGQVIALKMMRKQHMVDEQSIDNVLARIDVLIRCITVFTGDDVLPGY